MPRSQRLLLHPLVRRGDEAPEQRMRLVRLAEEFGMELAGDEKRMLRQFDDFDQFSVRRDVPLKTKPAFSNRSR